VSHATSSRAVRVSTSAVAGAGAATAAEGTRAMCRRPREGAVEGARGAALGAVDGHADAIMVVEWWRAALEPPLIFTQDLSTRQESADGLYAPRLRVGTKYAIISLRLFECANHSLNTVNVNLNHPWRGRIERSRT
jgi:hypothetical protein